MTATIPVTVTAGTLNFKIAAGTISFLGQEYVVPGLSYTIPDNSTWEFGAQVGGTPPDGVLLPCIVRLPAVEGLSSVHASQIFVINPQEAGQPVVINQTADFQGVNLYRIQSMNGIIVGVYDLRIYGGISSANFVNYALPAPSFGSTPVIQSGLSTNGIAADVDIEAIVTNVPQDGTVVAVGWFFREYNSTTPNAWTAYAQTSLSGNPNPTATQTVGFTFADLTNGKVYEFALSFVGLNGIPGITSLMSATGGFTAQTLSIAGHYFLGSGVPAPAPVVEAVTISVASAIVPGLSDLIELVFTLANQPTDGSLAYIGLWTRQLGTANWSDDGSIGADATGTGVANYTVYQTDVSNGVAWEFGVSYVGIEGTESSIVSIGSISAAALAIPTAYLQQGNGAAPALTSGPTYKEVPSTTGLTTDVNLSVVVSNLPTDGSLLGLVFFCVSVAGTGVQQPVSSGLISIIPPPTSGSSFAYTYGSLSNSTANPTDGQYIFAVAYAYTNGTYGSILQFAAYTVSAVTAIPVSYMLAPVIWTPTFTLTFIVNVGSVDGLTESVAFSMNITNQPTDGSFQRVNFFYKKSSNAVWIDGGGVQRSSGTANGNYIFEIDGIPRDNISPYDFGFSGQSNSGSETAVITFYSGWTLGVIQIPGSYLSNGTPVQPAITGAAITGAPSTNGLTSAAQLTFTVTNQPIDGSLSRINIYRTTNAQATAGYPYSAIASIPAVGVGGTSLPLAGSYNWYDNNLTNGTSYYYAISFENNAGLEGAIVYLGAFTGGAPQIPSHYQLSMGAYVPAATLTSISSQTYTDGIHIGVVLSFNITNQPTDGSLSRVTVWYAIQGLTFWSPYLSMPAVGAGSASPPSLGSYSVALSDLSAGQPYDFAITCEDTTGAETGSGGAAGDIGLTTLIFNYVSSAVQITPVQNKSIPSGASVAIFNLTQSQHIIVSSANYATGDVISGAVYYQINGTTDYSWQLGVEFYYQWEGSDGTVTGYPTLISSLSQAGAYQNGFFYQVTIPVNWNYNGASRALGVAVPCYMVLTSSSGQQITSPMYSLIIGSVE